MHKMKLGPLHFFVRHEHDEEIVQEIVIRNAYDKQKIGFRVHRGETWLDCGANIGVFAVWAEKMRGAIVHGYEACEENSEVARRNLEANNCRSTITTAFVGPNSQGRTRIGFNVKTPSRSSFALTENQRDVSNVCLADEIVKHKPAGLKIDIEGAEFPLLDAGFPLTGIRAICLEYHFRQDKCCKKARQRIEFLMKHFRHNRLAWGVRKQEVWGGWTDTVMLFWN